MSNEPKWIEWPGGECPVESETIVDLEYRGGKKTADRTRFEYGIEAGSRFWDREADSEQSYDIVRYRVRTERTL